MTVRLKIPPAIAVCPTDVEPLSTDGETIKCRLGCASKVEEWPNKGVQRFAREAKAKLERLADHQSR